MGPGAPVRTPSPPPRLLPGAPSPHNSFFLSPCRSTRRKDVSLAKCLHPTATAQQATADLVQWKREEGSLPLTPAIEHSDKRTATA